MLFDELIPRALAATVPTATKTADSSDLLGGETGAKSLGKISGFIWDHIDMWIVGIVIVVGSAILAKMASTAARDAMIRAKGEEVQENALVLVERMTKMLILLVGVTIALAINGLNFTAVIGAISLGIGFALKQFIENFISSVVMLSQNRIRIGDLVSIGTTLGRIVSIDMRTTVIQQLDGSTVTIPNQTMLSSEWTSYSANPFRRAELVVGVAYNTDLALATSLVKGILSTDANVVKKPEPSVLIDQFGESSIGLRVWFWVETNKAFFNIKSNISHKIKKAFDHAGISIPFPIRTLKLDENDRSFLTTMDSMHKGVVPEPKEPLSREKAAEAALSVEKEPAIPFNVFEEPKSAQVPVVAPTPPPLPPRPSGSPIPPPPHI